MQPLDFSFLTADSFNVLAQGMVISLIVTGTALTVGLLFGTVLAVLRVSRFRILSFLAACYINCFRSIPLAMVLLSFYLVVPELLAKLFWEGHGLDTRMASALVGFSLFEAAYYAEIMRAGIQSVPKGQVAAACALGMKSHQAMRLVILPQAARNMLPLLLTQLILLFQDTSLVYMISLTDFFTSAEGIGERDGRIEEMMIISAAVYLVICYSASLLVKRLPQPRPG